MGRVLDSIGNAAHSVYDTVRPVLPAVAAVATTLAGFPQFAPLAAGATSGAESYASNHNFGNALGNAAGSAAGSYIGGNIGNSFLNGGANSLASMGTVGNATGNVFGQSAANALSASAPQIAGSSLGGATGSLIGSNIGRDLGNSLTAPPPEQPTPWAPSRQANSPTPASLSSAAGTSAYGIGGLNQDQQLSNLASRGVFGGGISPEEQSYFLNQENRRLIDDSGNQQSLSSLSPVEMTYLQRLGLGGNNNTSDLLRAISQWQPA